MLNQGKILISCLKEKAPLLSLERVDIQTQYPDKNKLIVTVHNSGQRVALFKYAYTYVLNTSKGTAIANSVFTTEEILPNKNATWAFSQSNALTISPNTYYCTKVWYEDEEIKDTKPKELFYKLNVLNGIVVPSSIPNDVLKLFKAQISEYERSSLFKSTNTSE